MSAREFLSSFHTKTAQIRGFQNVLFEERFQKSSFSMEQSCFFIFLRGSVNGVLVCFSIHFVCFFQEPFVVFVITNDCRVKQLKSQSLNGFEIQGSQIIENC